MAVSNVNSNNSGELRWWSDTSLTRRRWEWERRKSAKKKGQKVLRDDHLRHIFFRNSNAYWHDVRWCILRFLSASPVVAQMRGRERERDRERLHSFHLFPFLLLRLWLLFFYGIWLYWVRRRITWNCRMSIAAAAARLLQQQQLSTAIE